MCEKLGDISLGYLRKCLKEFNIETPYQRNRRIAESVDLTEFVRLVEADTPKQEIFEKLGITKDIYFSLLRKTGVKSTWTRHLEDIAKITKEKLEELIASNKTVDEICKELYNISVPEYNNLLKKFGIKTDYSKRVALNKTITKEDIVSRLNKKMLKKDIIKELGISSIKYTQLIHEFGIETKALADKKNSKNITKEQLLELINDKKMLTRDIEKFLNISQATYCKLLKKFGIKTQRQVANERFASITKEELQAVIDEGGTVKQMISKLDVSESMFYKLIKYHNANYQFKHHNNELVIPKEVMEEMVQAGKTLDEIAKELNINQATFSNKAKIAKVNTNLRENKDKIANITKKELQALIDKGYTREEVCNELDITIPMCDGLIAKYNISTKCKQSRINTKDITKEQLQEMRASKKTIKEICAELGITPVTYQNIMKRV